jgi:hypothetical protein
MGRDSSGQRIDVEQQLLDLEQGRNESLSFDRYWNGTIDATVPLVSTPAGGR